MSQSQHKFADSEVSPLFQSAVDIVAEQMNGQVLLNHTIVDAWYLTRKIFQKAYKEKLPVVIVSGRLRADFYNELTEELEKLIKRKLPVHVYLAESDTPDVEHSSSGKNTFAEVLERAQEKDSENYELLCAGRLSESESKNRAMSRHVIYAGKDSALCFRLEKDTEKHTAIGSFGPRRPLITNHIGKIVADIAAEEIQEIKRRHQTSDSARA